MNIVELFCTVEENDTKNKLIKSLDTKSNYELILTEESFLLFELLDSGNGKIVFWSSLFSLTGMQLNKLTKRTIINFYDQDTDSDYQLTLKFDNILLFRDSLVKKMRALKIKVDSEKIMKGQSFKRLSEKEIGEMKMNDIEKHTKELQKRITKGEITDYTVKTFNNLCRKAVEYYSKSGNEKYIEYMTMLKSILVLEGVNKLMNEDEKEMKKFSESEI